MSNLSGGQRFIRQVNDAIYDVLYKLDSEDGEFWCECTDVYCDKRVLITLREYVAMKQREDAILLAPPHQHDRQR
jgi:hypothetical protein